MANLIHHAAPSNWTSPDFQRRIIPSIENLGPILPGSVLVCKSDTKHLSLDYAMQLAAELKKAAGHEQFCIISLDGMFSSMESANYLLDRLLALADRQDAERLRKCQELVTLMKEVFC